MIEHYGSAVKAQSNRLILHCDVARYRVTLLRAPALNLCSNVCVCVCVLDHNTCAATQLIWASHTPKVALMVHIYHIYAMCVS